MEKIESTDFTKIKYKRVYEDVVAQIKERIARGEFKPGDRLPTEREFIEKFGVSRVSLREAFRVLESNGIISSQPGGGRFVREANSSTLFGTEGFISTLELSQVRDLLEAREAIECKIAALAAKRGESEEIKKLRQILSSISSLNENSSQGISLFDLDSSFHNILAMASHNTVFINWLTLSLEILKELRRGSLLVDERPKALVRELSEIVDAVEEGNAQAAAGAMRRHLRAVRRQFKKIAKKLNY